MKLRNTLLASAFIFLSIFVLSAQQQNEKPSIIPQPANISWQGEYYTLPQETTICYNASAEKMVPWLQKLLANTDTETQLSQDGNCEGFSLKIDNEWKSALGEEGYRLNIDDKGVHIESATESGLFYGIQTLRQMFPAAIEKQQIAGEIHLKMVKIEDIPRYGWRGSMLDVARSFFGPEYIKKHIDRMALYKMNRLHLHLTDDQGWRIEIKSKPKLTELGSKGAVINGRAGYLTQDDYKELQSYATARNIIIIPEIDMPGHMYAGLMAYPELNCEEFENLSPKRATPPELYHGYEVGWSKFCTTDPKIYDFVSEVIGELARITTGPWIHMGGDEIEDPRYEEFVVKADSIVRKYGKTTIGWEEVTKAEVDTSMISQRWNGKTEGVVTLKYIESICSSFYLDHANVPGQENTNNWCKADGVSLEDVYMFNEGDERMMGVEAALWTEKVNTSAEADNRFWPRLLAVAEVGWSPKNSRDFTDFSLRLGKQGSRLSNLNIHYFKTPEIDWDVDYQSGVFDGFEVGE